MKTHSIARHTVLGLASSLLLLALTTEANSQPKPESIIARSRRVQEKQALLLEQQAKTLATIEELQKKADQVRIFAKRG